MVNTHVGVTLPVLALNVLLYMSPVLGAHTAESVHTAQSSAAVCQQGLHWAVAARHRSHILLILQRQYPNHCSDPTARRNRTQISLLTQLQRQQQDHSSDPTAKRNSIQISVLTQLKEEADQCSNPNAKRDRTQIIVLTKQQDLKQHPDKCSEPRRRRTQFALLTQLQANTASRSVF